MTRLAGPYRSGRGVQINEREAVRWYRQAAQGRQVSAMGRLGDLYAQGQGVSQDDTQAAQWYVKAAQAGQVHAMQRLGDLYAGVPSATPRRPRSGT
ncbi:tetratricopeptide repeat protein [Deinococcus sp.]|uniref:tetratricopeptide repeat protein n=1 Tax=Deinococcus sp. TaxID=47478 RepID=UPI002869D4C4|nr:tetratricopeptide repeat protein [Deinococcus sp.]